jgi:hypothetical protein
MAGKLIPPLPQKILTQTNSTPYAYNNELVNNIPVYSLLFSQASSIGLITVDEIETMLNYAIGSSEQKNEVDRLSLKITTLVNHRISSEATILDRIFNEYNFCSEGFNWNWDFSVNSVDHVSPEYIDEMDDYYSLVHEQCGLHALPINVMDAPNNLQPYYIRLIKYLCFVSCHPTIFDLCGDECVSSYYIDEELDFDDDTVLSILKLYEENIDIRECFSTHMDEPDVLSNYVDDDLYAHLSTLQFKRDMSLFSSQNDTLTWDDFSVFEAELRHEPNTPQWFLDLVMVLPKCFSQNNPKLDAFNIGHIHANFLLPVIFGTENESRVLSELHDMSMIDGDITGLAIDLSESNIAALTAMNKAELILFFMHSQLKIID